MQVDRFINGKICLAHAVNISLNSIIRRFGEHLYFKYQHVFNNKPSLEEAQMVREQLLIKG